MESENTYENTEVFFECRGGRTGGNGESSKPERRVRSLEPARRNLFPWVICTVLSFCILLSVMAPITAIMLRNHAKNLNTIAKLQDEILQLNKNHQRCPTEWTRFRESCYQFSSSKKAWVEALRQCASINANLIVINSAEEQEYILLNATHDYWIGLHDIGEEEIWRWVDGTNYSSNVKFWASGQPDDYKVHGKLDEDCVVVNENGLWHDWPCDSMHFAICEKRAA